MAKPPMKCKHFCTGCYRSQQMQKEVKRKGPFIPVLPPAFPSFTHIITSYKANMSAEKHWFFFQRPTSCLHWVGKLR